MVALATIVFCCSMMFLSGIAFARARATNPAGNESDILVKYEIARNKCNIARYQWYDFFEEGYMSKAPQGEKMVDQARKLIDLGKAAVEKASPTS